MIENKELGLKVAENKEEAFWVKVKEDSQKEIDHNKRAIIINEAIIGLAEKKIKENKEE